MDIIEKSKFSEIAKRKSNLCIKLWQKMTYRNFSTCTSGIRVFPQNIPSETYYVLKNVKYQILSKYMWCINSKYVTILLLEISHIYEFEPPLIPTELHFFVIFIRKKGLQKSILFNSTY